MATLVTFVHIFTVPHHLTAPYI